MQTFEYLTLFLEADAKKFLSSQGQRIEPYTPRSLMPQLNEFGAQGWELISLTPYQVGVNEDTAVGGAAIRWTHTYFAVFKRAVNPQRT